MLIKVLRLIYDNERKKGKTDSLKSKNLIIYISKIPVLGC